MISEETFKVVVKPGSKSNALLGFDESRKAYVVRISAPAEKDKANKELIRFLSKELKKKVSIIKGLRSREKIIRID